MEGNQAKVYFTKSYGAVHLEGEKLQKLFQKKVEACPLYYLPLDLR